MSYMIVIFIHGSVYMNNKRTSHSLGNQSMLIRWSDWWRSLRLVQWDLGSILSDACGGFILCVAALAKGSLLHTLVLAILCWLFQMTAWKLESSTDIYYRLYVLSKTLLNILTARAMFMSCSFKTITITCDGQMDRRTGRQRLAQGHHSCLSKVINMSCCFVTQCQIAYFN